jgi:hypothetical protein
VASIATDGRFVANIATVECFVVSIATDECFVASIATDECFVASIATVESDLQHSIHILLLIRVFRPQTISTAVLTELFFVSLCAFRQKLGYGPTLDWTTIAALHILPNLIIKPTRYTYFSNLFLE